MFSFLGFSDKLVDLRSRCVTLCEIPIRINTALHAHQFSQRMKFLINSIRTCLRSKIQLPVWLPQCDLYKLHFRHVPCKGRVILASFRHGALKNLYQEPTHSCILSLRNLEWLFLPFSKGSSSTTSSPTFKPATYWSNSSRSSRDNAWYVLAS